MTIAESEVVDAVAMSADSSSVRLVITDHLDWSAEGEHLLMLQDKLNAYLRFVESGELTEKFPKAAGKRVQLEAVFLHEPTEHVRSHFLARAQEIVHDAGMIFSWRVSAG